MVNSSSTQPQVTHNQTVWWSFVYLKSILMASYDRLRGFENECEEANIVLKIIDSGVWQHCVRMKGLRWLKLKSVVNYNYLN